MSAGDWPTLAPAIAAALERGPLADRPRRDVREHGGRTVRYGRRGSLRLTVTGPAAGTWTDHEAGASGGVLQLVIHVGAADSARAAADWLRQHGVDPPESPHRPPNGAPPARSTPRACTRPASRPERPRAAWTGARWRPTVDLPPWLPAEARGRRGRRGTTRPDDGGRGAGIRTVKGPGQCSAVRALYRATGDPSGPTLVQSRWPVPMPSTAPQNDPLPALEGAHRPLTDRATMACDNGGRMVPALVVAPSARVVGSLRSFPQPQTTRP